jgi:hypothetical protein
VAPRASYLTYPNYLRKHKAQSQQKLPSLLSQENYKNNKSQDWTPTEKEIPQRKNSPNDPLVAPRAPYLTYRHFLRKHKERRQQKLPSLPSQDNQKKKKPQDRTSTENENLQPNHFQKAPLVAPRANYLTHPVYLRNRQEQRQKSRLWRRYIRTKPQPPLQWPPSLPSCTKHGRISTWQKVENPKEHSANWMINPSIFSTISPSHSPPNPNASRYSLPVTL